MPRAVQISQFSDPQIPFEVAASLCGPAAAIAFARVNGRNPTLKEAQALAEGVGWTAAAGMAGPASEQALLRKMGIEAELTPSADWQRVTADVQSGKPVIISTPRHYFTVSDVDDQGRYYVGASGTDLKGGKEWLTADELVSQGRGINGALHLTSAPSVPRERQQFLEANSPGESAPTITPSPATPDLLTGSTSSRPKDTSIITPEKPVDSPMDRPTTPAQDSISDWLKRELASSAWSRKLMEQFGEPPTPPQYRLPGLPKIDLGWRRSKFSLPEVY